MCSAVSAENSDDIKTKTENFEKWAGDQSGVIVFFNFTTNAEIIFVCNICPLIQI